MISQLTTQTAARTFTSLRGKFQPDWFCVLVGNEPAAQSVTKPRAYSLEPSFMSADSTSDDWNVYRTRFLVRAKQLTQPLVFTDPLGREHRGLPGDYLVQSSEGLLRIAPQEIFEDVYVPLEQEPRRALPAVALQLHPSTRNLSA